MESCGGRIKQRKRVALCGNGYHTCHPRDLCCPCPCTSDRLRMSGSSDQAGADMLKPGRAADTDSARPDENEGATSCYEDVHCEECLKGDNDDQMLLCDECDRGFHMYCLRPKATTVPPGNWFCPLCIRPTEVQGNIPPCFEWSLPWFDLDVILCYFRFSQVGSSFPCRAF